MLEQEEIADRIIGAAIEVHKRQARGARLLFQPPYAPEVNPLENAWAFMKDVIRSLEPRSIEALDDAVVAGARQITPRHARNFFGHCGYQFNR